MNKHYFRLDWRKHIHEIHKSRLKSELIHLNLSLTSCYHSMFQLFSYNKLLCKFQLLMESNYHSHHIHCNFYKCEHRLFYMLELLPEFALFWIPCCIQLWQPVHRNSFQPVTKVWSTDNQTIWDTHIKVLCSNFCNKNHVTRWLLYGCYFEFIPNKVRMTSSYYVIFTVFRKEELETRRRASFCY